MARIEPSEVNQAKTRQDPSAACFGMDQTKFIFPDPGDFTTEAAKEAMSICERCVLSAECEEEGRRIHKIGFAIYNTIFGPL